jgi:hypothetical protein
MQTKYIKSFKKTLLFTSLCIVLVGMLFTSCEKDEGTNGVTVLNSFGPCPIARGAELRFIGENLDKVDTIILPGNIVIKASEFGTQSSELITITVPQNAIPGLITLKTPDGPITTKTELGFSEPISITNFSPTSTKADSVITITGDYLNLIKQVIFNSNIAVDQANFISQSRYQLQVKVPAAAQTGKIAISNGADNPIIIYTTSNLTLALPAITTVSPNPVKAGTALTITGTDLHLVKTVIFGGNKKVTSFTSQSTTQIVLNVPEDAQDDTLKVVPASDIIVKSSSKLVMVVPTVSVTPTSVKNGGTITVTGTNLDLINVVTFGGSKIGTIQAGGTTTQITVTVPNDALTGVVKFTTKAAKDVLGPIITMIDPTITSITPTTAKPKSNIVIAGTDLDLVVSFVFSGGVKGTIGTRSETELNVTVPVGAKDGVITLVTKNGTQINSATSLIIPTNLPEFSSYTEAKGTPGAILTINGTNMDLIKSLVFPGNVTATDYGIKSSTMVQVYVPTNVLTGNGQIKMITYEGEEGLLPELFFGSTDPILATTLMISNFNGSGASQSTWGSVVTFGTPTIYLDGTACMIGKTGSGWNWTWSQNWDTRPALAHPEKYVLKMDICITKAAAGVDAGMTLKGWDTSVSLGQPFGTTTNGFWITKTFDVLNSSMVIDGTGDWGIWINGSSFDLTGVMIDNLRFDLK